MAGSRTKQRLRSIAIAATVAALCGATTLVSHVVDPFFEGAHLEILFLSVVVFASARWGRWPGVLAALLSTVCYDYFFLPPRYSFHVSAPYILSLLLLLGIALLVGTLAARLRREALTARREKESAQATAKLARDLSGAIAQEQALELVQKRIEEAMGWTPSFHPGIDPPALGPGSAAIALKAPRKVRGHLVCPVVALDARERELLEAWASLLGLSLERIHYVEVARDALLRMEGEKLRGHILSTLSHDLRTPLTSIVAQAQRLGEGLRRAGADDEQIRLSGELVEESRRMGDLVSNLLELSRLQSGGVQLRQDWHSLPELFESALRHRRSVLEGRDVALDVPDDLPLVWGDGVLLERVLVNLLDNAGRHTPPGSPLRLWARRDADGYRFGLDDHGQGFPDDALARDTGRGGIGLSLCRAIARAHRGDLVVGSVPGGGASVHMRLPDQPPPPEDPVEQS